MMSVPDSSSVDMGHVWEVRFFDDSNIGTTCAIAKLSTDGSGMVYYLLPLDFV